ncbi:MAG TPA: hypothetical protein VMT30_07390 [Candidatus Saccharimonadia bacterium]|nr:hypothetical protein [Candidatus Saccharimonadia bacterium]
MTTKLLLHPHTAANLATFAGAAGGSAIFHGAPGLGKSAAVRELAMRLNCLGDEAGPCAHCRAIVAGNFPDLLWLDRGDKASLGIEAVRGLTAELGLRPYRAAAVRMVGIPDAQLLTPEAQNALLKLLEEPPPATLIILTTTRVEALLLTVRSRCRLVHFVAPGETAVATLLTSTHGVPGATAQQLATAAGGAPGTAIALVEHPETAQALLELTRQADAIASHSLFERLLLAARLAAPGTDLEQFGSALHRRLIAATANGTLGPAQAAVQLGALERFRRGLQAKMAPRVALERLMLELGQ